MKDSEFPDLNEWCISKYRSSIFAVMCLLIEVCGGKEVKLILTSYS